MTALNTSGTGTRNTVSAIWSGDLTPPEKLPQSADVVIIGGGIVGVSTAWFLAKRGIDVVLCEKGFISGEQSGRNWGWVRVQGRDPREVPMMLESMAIWRSMTDEIGEDVGYTEGGCLYAARSDKDLSAYESWLDIARQHDIPSRLISQDELRNEIGSAASTWTGALYTHNDGRAEPHKAGPAIARAAIRAGANIITGCAVRGLSTAAGRVAGVVTEFGEIQTSTVLCAAGAWSSMFCRSLGISVPQLKVRGTVARTAPADIPLRGNLFDSKIGIRRRQDGGYTVAHGSVLDHGITPSTLRYSFKFLPALRRELGILRIRFGRDFMDELNMPSRWALDRESPFESRRVLNPAASPRIVKRIRKNLAETFPALANVEILEAWAGMVETSPDVVPIIGEQPSLPGFHIATGFSGHGFGLGPGAGKTLAAMLTGTAHDIDLHAFRLERFFDGTPSGRRPPFDPRQLRTVMTKTLTTVCLAVTAFLSGPAAAQPQTMRVDYYHSGNSNTELFSLDRVVVEPLPWPGNPAQPLDVTRRGKYVLEILLTENEERVYSRSFSSIYGEWETTAEADEINRTFHESARFPQPDEEFDLLIHKRDSDNLFQEVWRTRIDPGDYLVHRESAAYADQVTAIEVNGDPAEKVDLLLLGDGYTAAEHERFVAKARELTGVLFATPPFRERRSDFNVWALAPAADRSGVSRPSTGVYRDSPFGATYDAFRSERYVLTYENKAMRAIMSSAPYDFVEVLTNTDTYGGGGIYGLYSTAAANSDWAGYLFVHEFGHHFAGLADEYYTSSVAYEAPDVIREPYEPNVTALLDAGELKWKHLVSDLTPLPTPWPKVEYEKHALAYQARRAELRADNVAETEMNALFRSNQDIVEGMFSAAENASVIGAFEGALYQSQGTTGRK